MSSLLKWLFGEEEHYTFPNPELERFRAVQAALVGPNGDNATLYSQTAALVSAADFPEPTTFAKRVLLRFVDTCDEKHIPVPHFQIIAQMAGAAAGIYAAERFKDLPPNPARYGLHGDSVALGRIRDLLLHQQIKALNPNATLEAPSNALIA